MNKKGFLIVVSLFLLPLANALPDYWCGYDSWDCYDDDEFDPEPELWPGINYCDGSGCPVIFCGNGDIGDLCPYWHSPTVLDFTCIENGGSYYAHYVELDCPAGYLCEPVGSSAQCVESCLDAGSACSGGGCCSGLTCVDGVCCNEPCAGLCERCDTGTVGTCEPEAYGQDQQGDCPSGPVCIGDTYYLNTACDGSGGCTAGSGDIGCCQGSKCTGDKQYCKESTHTCEYFTKECATDIDLGFGYEPQLNGEDEWNECEVEWAGCDAGGCNRTQGDGACEGGVYQCDVDDNTEEYCPVNTVCTDGICGAGICLNSEHCSGNAYFQGFTCNGAGVCDEDTNGIGCCQGSNCTLDKQYCNESTHACEYFTQECAKKLDADFGYEMQDATEDLWDECDNSPSRCDSVCTWEGGEGLCSGIAFSCDDDGYFDDCPAGTYCTGAGSCEVGACETVRHCSGFADYCQYSCDGFGACTLDYDCMDCAIDCCSCGPYGQIETDGNGNCDDTYDNDCDDAYDRFDTGCLSLDGMACAVPGECMSGYCDINDGGASFEPYTDEEHCYTPQPNPGGWIDEQDDDYPQAICDASSGQGDADCDEFRNATDCSYLVAPNDGRHYWCNEVCELENRDTSEQACNATGINCLGAYVWLDAGESTTPEEAGSWEYAQGDKITIECCGDDYNETPRHRNSSCTEIGCTLNDEPLIGDDATDTACCNSSLDCIYDDTCYTSDDEGGSPQTFGGDNPLTNSVVCENGYWFDCDNSQGACNEANGRCEFGDAWKLSGEAGVGEYDFVGKYECCGDDANEFLINSSEFQGMESEPELCCDAQDDCIFNGVCNKSDANGGRELSCYDGKDSDCDGATDFCDGRHPLPCSRYDGLEDDCALKIRGTVNDTLGNPIEGAEVIAITPFDYGSFSEVIRFINYTNATGDYSITVYANSSYEIVVTKSGYNVNSENSRELEFESEWIVNVILTLDHGCQPSCTMHDDSLCHADCNGSNGCLFYDGNASILCDGLPKDAIVVYNDTHTLTCCEGSPFKQLISSKPIVEVLNSTYVYKGTRLVLYRGKPIQMVTVTFD